MVPTALHISFLLIIAFQWILSLQQICISAFFMEWPRSLYRLLTNFYVFNSFCFFFVCSIYFEYPTIEAAVGIHMLNFTSQILTLLIAYPLILSTILYIYCNGEFHRFHQIPKLLLRPWKYLIGISIAMCLIFNSLSFMSNSLLPLLYFDIMINGVFGLCCIIFLFAFADASYRISSIHLSSRLRSNNYRLIISAMILICLGLLVYSIITVYWSIQSYSFYEHQTLYDMSYNTSARFINVFIFDVCSNGVLFLWLHKSTNYCRFIDNGSCFHSCFSCCFCSCILVQNGDNQLVSDVQQNQIPIAHEKMINSTVQLRNNAPKLSEIANKSFHSLTAISSNLRTFMHNARSGSGSDTVTRKLFRCKLFVYEFDHVFTDGPEHCNVFYMRTCEQILQMSDKEFLKIFGDENRRNIIQQHLKMISEQRVIYCFSRRLKLDILQTILYRLQWLVYFHSSIPLKMQCYLRYIYSAFQLQNHPSTSSNITPAPAKMFGDLDRHMPIILELNSFSKHSDVQITPNITPIGPYHSNLESELAHVSTSRIPITSSNRLTVVGSNSPNVNPSPSLSYKLRSASPESKLDEEKLPMGVLPNLTISVDMSRHARGNAVIQSGSGSGSGGGSGSGSRSTDSNTRTVSPLLLDMTEEIRSIYDKRLFGKDSVFMTQDSVSMKCSSMILKLMQYFQLSNDEILFVSNSAQNAEHFNTLNLCQTYIVQYSKLNVSDVKNIQHFL